MPSPATTTLHDIISTLDDKLALAEINDANTATPSLLFSSQEKMNKYVLVIIDAEKLAIPIEGLAEIGPMPPITPLPNLPPWIHGIINQRGEIISVIDINMLFSSKSSAKMKNKIAILYNSTMKIGMGIDQVTATISRPDSDCVPLSESALSTMESQVFHRGLRVGTDLYQILEPASFLTMDRLMHYYLSE
jgi:purine-binding chemotaxis protein CheW